MPSNQEFTIDGETFQLLGIAKSQRDIDFVRKIEAAFEARPQADSAASTDIAPFRSRVTASASNVQLAAARLNRVGLTIHNDSDASLYICEGAVASATSYDQYIPPGGVWEADRPIYTGVINGIWASATGAAQITDRV